MALLAFEKHFHFGRTQVNSDRRVVDFVENTHLGAQSLVSIPSPTIAQSSKSDFSDRGARSSETVQKNVAGFSDQAIEEGLSGGVALTVDG